MSKQRKTGRESEQKTASAADRAVEASEESLLGNRAVAEQLGGHAHEAREIGLDAVRDVAFPLIERASLALHLEPKPAGEVERFVAILERSHFDRSHKDSLIDKVEGDQAAALAVQDAVERSLGEVDEEVRSAIIEALDGTWMALHEGAPGEGAWLQGDREFALSGASLEGSTADRAGGLIADLVEQLGSETLKQGLEGDAGASVARFCRSVVLAYFFEEEEEEEQGVSMAPEES